MSETTAMAVAALRVAYPRQDFPDDSVRLYVRMLADLDAATVSRAVERLIRRSTWLPSIAEIRMEAAEEICPLPTPAEAWSVAIGAGGEGWFARTPLEVRESIAACGGRYAIMHSERPETIRAQFLRDYEQRRTAAIQGAAQATPPNRLVAREMRNLLALAETTVVDEIPETDSMRPRPVYARWMRRVGGDAQGAPTPEEIHDAILVLRDEQGGDVLHEEAQRIMDAASAA